MIVSEMCTDSVLVMFRSYPGDPNLQDYLKLAINDGLIPVSTFVSTLLQAARSSELHIPATLDTLIRTALDAHYTSGRAPIGSVVPLDQPAPAVFRTIQDALALLRTAYALPMSHFHQLPTSAAELVILLLACVTDLHSVPNAQAVVLYDEMMETLGMCRLLGAAVVGVLDTFMVSLSLLIGDDVKAAREAQMMRTTQFAQGKGDMWGPSSETDVVSGGLLLNYMVCSSKIFRSFADLYPFPRLHTQHTIGVQATPQTQWRYWWRASAGLLGRQPYITRSSSYPH